MENNAFTPHNELEQKLLDAQEGRIPGEQFMQDLLEANIFLPVKDSNEIANFQRDDKANPLLLEDENGVQTLAIFTSPERAKPVLAGFPGFNGGILVTLSWVLEKVGTGFPITLNPGSDIGLDLETDMLEQLASMPKT